MLDPSSTSSQATMEDLTQRLPHDVLADVLRHLQTTAPCSLAACRCVCKAWCAVIDAHRLITELLPNSLTGIFVHLDGEMLPRHFSLGMSSTNIVPFDYLDTLDHKPLDGKCLKIKQHCNGLLLLADVECEEEWWVLNPATRQWAHLPPSPPMCTPGMEDNIYAQGCDTYYHDNYLVFDPSLSSHYEVLLVKCIPSTPDLSRFVECHIKRTEWPPSTYVLLVFSSRTKQWEKRHFVREGEAAGTIGDLLELTPPNHCFASYWAGSLYFHHHDFILRITLRNDKYQVIEPPEGVRWGDYPDHNLGKSENGVYCALLDGHDGLGLRIWHLDETDDQIRWMLKCDINLHPLLADLACKHNDCPSEWSYSKHTLLGFHPNGEIVFFFHRTSKRVMAYHLNSSKIQDHGCLPADCTCVSFPYTMCLVGELSSNKH